MFDVGFQEVVLIGIIALLVIGPERLPMVARKIGLYVGKMQRFVAGVKTDIHNELNTAEVRKLLDSQEDQIQELKAMVNETRTDFERTARDATGDIKKGMDQAVGQVRDAADTVADNAAPAAGSESDADQAEAEAVSQVTDRASPGIAITPDSKPNTG